MKRFFVFAMFLWTGIMGASAQEDRCDVNGDGVVNINDVIYVVDHVLGKGHVSTLQAIDLGLPSGTKWASCNVGATKPEEFGGYYAWGETEEKEVYNESTYKYYQNGSYVSLGSDISGTEYDVAHVKWGGDWVMPTADDFRELFNYCTSEWTTFNGVNGRKFTGPNGNSIFFPAAGCSGDGDVEGVGEFGYCWSSTQVPEYSGDAIYLYFRSDYADSSGWTDDRLYGFNIRPVVRN